MSDSQHDNAEQLDGNVLGEKPGDDTLPGVNQFVERRPLHSEDPALLMGGSETEDDLRTREWRERDDLAADDPAASGDHHAADLLNPDEGGAAAVDDEAQLIAHEQEPTSPDVAPEVDAIHLVDE